MRKSLSLIVLCAMLAGVAPAASATKVGVVLAGSSLVFWKAMTRGVEQAAAQLHVELVMRSPSDGASLGAQANVQLKMIDYLVKSGVDGIVLAAEPLKDVARPVSITVPMVLVDRNSNDYNAISTVATDNFAAGRAAALSLASVLQKGATVAVLRLSPDITSTTAREDGFLSVARTIGWSVVVDTYVGYQFRETEERVRKALNGYTGHLDAVFAPNETTSYGALRVVDAMPAGDRPHLVIFDWRPEFLDALKRGVIYADMVQDPYRMGYQAVETLVSAVRGHAPQPKVFVDVVAVTPANMDSSSIRALLASYNP
jgi:ribose transport system substrate-binding protein